MHGYIQYRPQITLLAKKNTIQGAFIPSHIAINFSNKWVIFGHLTSNQNQEVQNIRERETCKIDIEKIILPK